MQILRRRFRSHPVFWVTMLALVFFVCVLLVEGILRFRSDVYYKKLSQQIAPTYGLSYHLSDGTLLSSFVGRLRLYYTPNLVYRIFPSQKTNEFTINSHGYRGREFSELSSGKKRVLILGGSTAFCSGVTLEADSLHRRLETLHPKVGFINGGVIGYRSAQEMAVLKELIPLTAPTEVVSLTGVNDYWGGITDADLLNWSAASPQYAAYSRVEETLQAWAAIKYLRSGVLLTLSELLFRGISDTIRTQVRNNPDRFFNEMHLDHAARQLTDNLEAMAKICKSAGIKYRVILQPHKAQFTREQLTKRERREGEGYGLFLARVSKILESSSIPTKYSSSIPFVKEDFLDSVHLSPSGIDKLAKEI